jgi:WD40 repeat protein
VDDDDLQAFITDAEQFVRTYSEMMGISTPHIYLSSLAFIPPGSPLHKMYLRQYPGVIKVTPDVSSPIRWPSVLLEIKEPSFVLSTQYSRDGKLIVSGSDDRTIRVWDAHTARIVAGPFEGHTGEVSSVEFSPDGKFIVSGSDDRTIRVWHARIAQLAAGPFKGYTRWVSSVGFSPNGKLIVSGSPDSTVRVWDAHTGQLVSGPFEGHTDTVSSVEFSPDGKFIVSGSYDATIRVYDALIQHLPAVSPIDTRTCSSNSLCMSVSS